MQVPGKVGWPVVGDRSYEFYKDPVNFLLKNIEATKSKVFGCRFLNKPTVFVCSNEAVKNVLNNPEGALEMGYKEVLGQMFGDNILFRPDIQAASYREGLKKLASTELLADYQVILERILEKHLNSIGNRSSIRLYRFFKDIFTELCLTLFLGVNFEECPDLAERFKALTKTHWRGIVALPVDLNIPGMGYSKALQAKKTLLELINCQKMNAIDGFPQYLKKMEEFDESAVDHHLLLFSTELVPKVMASICTSVGLEVSQSGESDWQTRAFTDNAFLDVLILEANRLHPPLLGGRRIARKDCRVGEYAIPKDHAVVYMTYFAHRDADIFQNPDEFKPSRWVENPGLQEKLFVYGLGPRACVGQELASLFLKTTLSRLFSTFQLEVDLDQDFSRKHIPVSRPRKHVMATLTRR